MISSLTSMRFFAALLVFIYHYKWIEFDFSNWPLEKLWINLVSFGFIGVSFFYVLSGFVLAYAYHSKFTALIINTKQFYIARFARIYPLHILTLVFAMPLMMTSPWHESFFTSLPFNLTLTQSFIPEINYYFSFNSPSWSISNEIFFYALFPFLVLRKEKTLVLLMAIIFSVIIFSWGLLKFINYEGNIWNWLFYINPFFRLFEFIFGILTYRAYSWTLSFSNNKNGETWQRFISFFETLAVFLVLLAIYYLNEVPDFIVKSIFFSPFFALIVFLFSFQAGCISKLLSNKILVYLGEISFAMYMLHQIIIRYMYESYISEILYKYNISGFILVLLIVLLLSSISFHLFEMPLNKWIRRRIKL